jgi:hypothetical protein
VCISWVAAMRRRPQVVSDSRPSELMDAARWPQCLRWDGGAQPCVCWFSRAQEEWIEAGNDWPGDALASLLDLFRVHECNEPFDPGKI